VTTAWPDGADGQPLAIRCRLTRPDLQALSDKFMKPHRAAMSRKSEEEQQRDEEQQRNEVQALEELASHTAAAMKPNR
jgi:hypothetical protein